MNSSESALVAELLERLNDHDSDALGELFSHFHQRLKTIAKFRLDHRLKGRVSDSDVIQETYIDAAKRIEHFLKKPDMPVFVWLRLLLNQHLTNLHREHLQTQKRDARKEISLDQPAISENTSLAIAAHLVGRGSSPSRALSRAEQISVMEKALNEMKPLDQEIIAMRHFEELSNSETAQALGINQVTASSRYLRAMRRLREILANVPGFETS